jgi:hypothetical protein
MPIWNSVEGMPVPGSGFHRGPDGSYAIAFEIKKKMKNTLKVNLKALASRKA